MTEESVNLMRNQPKMFNIKNQKEKNWNKMHKIWGVSGKVRNDQNLRENTENRESIFWRNNKGKFPKFNKKILVYKSKKLVPLCWKQNKTTPRHIIIKLLKCYYKEKILKTFREKHITLRR